MRFRSPTRRLQVEFLEKRLALAADFVVDGDTTSNPAAQIAMVGSDLYFSTNNGTETQIRRYSNGSLINLAQHQVFGDFGNAAPTFFHEVANGLMYGLTDPFFQENVADATFQIWYAAAGTPPRLVRELPVMSVFGSYQQPTDATAVNGGLLLRDASTRYQLINPAGMTLDTWAAPADPSCAGPSYGPAHAAGDGVTIEASYNCNTFLTPLYVRTDGITLDEVEVHPSSLYLPNGTQISSAFSRDRNAEELIFETTSGREAIDATGKALQPESLTRFGTDKVFFSADDQIRGREPWITDGTRAGTQILRDISGLASSNPEVIGTDSSRFDFRGVQRRSR